MTKTRSANNLMISNRTYTLVNFPVCRLFVAISSTKPRNPKRTMWPMGVWRLKLIVYTTQHDIKRFIYNHILKTYINRNYTFTLAVRIPVAFSKIIHVTSYHFLIPNIFGRLFYIENKCIS